MELPTHEVLERDGIPALKREVSRAPHYQRQYRAVVEAVAALPDNGPYVTTLVAMASYAWVPTVLRGLYPDDVERAFPLGRVRSMTSGSANEFLKGLDENKRLNGSWVGTSKMLHFINPRVFPIWDSRIARVVGAGYLFNSRDKYLSYFTAMTDCVARPEFARVIGESRKLIGNEASAIRALEVIVFALGYPGRSSS